MDSRPTGRGGRAAVALATLSFLAGCISIELPGGPPGPLVETVVEGEGSAKILLVEIDGLITETPTSTRIGFGEQESTVARVRAELERARDDDAVEAVLLRIQSPGGTATASEILYREIRSYKEETGRPVLAEFMGVATSGAYYAAMAADAVYAHPTSVTGSIGVILSGVNLSGLMEKIGVADQTLTSGAFKDAGSPLRPMRPVEREQLQSVLDDLYDRFKQVVAQGRPDLDPARLAEVADGRIFSAKQAMQHGLIDGIVDLPGAVDEARRRAGLDRARVVTYHRRREWRENLYTRAPSPAGGLLEAFSLLQGLQTPTFLYLWRPGL